MRNKIFSNRKLPSFLTARKAPFRMISDVRINFSGQFMTNPSTINNSMGNYSEAVRLSRADFQKNITDNSSSSKGSWAPYGAHAWTFENCQVTYSCVGMKPDSSLDGYSMNPVRSETTGRIADLDPQMQIISQIWGFKVAIDKVLLGDYQPSAFIEMWKRRDGDHGDALLSAVYQSVLENVRIQPSSDSEILKELKKSCQLNDNKLSITMVVDGYTTANNESYARGRVVGSIFPYTNDHPYTALISRHIIIDKAIYPTPVNSRTLGTRTMKAKIINQQLLVDFSNFIPTNSDLSMKNIGDIHIGYYDGESRKEVALLPPSQYTNTEEFYLKKAGIVSFPLFRADLHKIKNIPLVCWYQNINGEELEYKEDAHGIHLMADRLFHRLEAGEEFSEQNNNHQARFYASKFGEIMPLSNKNISLITSVCNNSTSDKTQMSEDTVQAIESSEELKLKAEILPSHERKDYALMKLTAPKSLKLDFGSEIGKQPPRYDFALDSLVYEISYLLKISAETTIVGYHPIYCLVFDDFVIPKIPTWVEHIKIIFSQYANLYPVMFNIFDLSDYTSVINNLSSLKRAFSAEKTDQFYMPVTRDLSSNKQKMIIQWLNNPVYSSTVPVTLKAIQNPNALKLALQQAIQLELTTILLYMAALYSIKQPYNSDVSAIFQSILRQEMKHLVMVCNLIHAIGGRPEIEAATPVFPSSMPGGVLPGLVLNIGPCTKENIEEYFMTIEEPGYISHDDLMSIIQRSTSENLNLLKNINSFTYTRFPEGNKEVIFHFPHGKGKDIRYFAKKQDVTPEISNTIGQFYRNIADGLDYLNQTDSKQLFCGDPQKQMDSDDLPDIFAVHDLATAHSAIDKITSEGEGASFAQPTNQYGDLAHYFKFLQIVIGRKITGVKSTYNNGVETYQFTLGDEINLDEQQVVTDKSVWESQSQEPRLLFFVETYASLLAALQQLFDGQHDKLHQTIAIMRYLQVQAMQLLCPPLIQSVEYKSIAPSFDLSKLNAKNHSEIYKYNKLAGIFTQRTNKGKTDQQTTDATTFKPLS